MAKSLVCHHCGFTPPGGAPAAHCPTDGTRLIPLEEHEKSPHDPYLGRTLGDRYALLGLLGEGAMGAVYLARQMPLDREVAVKVIRPVAAAGNTKAREQLAQRFLREAQLQADFNHHAVVTVLDFGAEPDGTLFMVMERLNGHPLSHALAEGLESRVLAGMMMQILDALGRFHDRGHIHRDIKPDNIMVLEGPPTGEGMPRVKLLDFGIAKSVRDGTNPKLTQDGTVFGTPEYMAPEQALGVPELVDHRCDLYSVGAVLYEGLTGQPPFTGTSPLAILHRVVSGAVKPLPDTVPAALASVVTRALQKDRDARHADAREMAQALAQAVGLVRERPTVTTGRNRVSQGGPQPASAAPRPMTAPVPALAGETTEPDANALQAEATAPPVSKPPKARPATDPPESARRRGTAPPSELAPRLSEREHDPRDAFAFPSADEPDSAEMMLRGRRRPWLLVSLAFALVGGVAGAWYVLRPGPPITLRPVSDEPVRVQVNARFDAPDVGSPPSRAPRK